MTQIVVVPNRDAKAVADLVLCPEYNIQTGLNEFKRTYQDVTSLESDLLRLAAAVYCADLAVKRGEREQFLRDFEVSIPVANYHAMERFREDLEVVLHTLSNDNWTIRFLRLEEAPEENRQWPENEGNVLLFSGGLDSLAGAYSILVSELTPLALVSHVTSNAATRKSQEDLFGWLASKFPGRVTRDFFYVSGRNKPDLPFPDDREDTQRTRSFMFITLASLVARRKGLSKVIFIAENGPMAIHLPLTQARVSAFSTKTAHPDFLSEMQLWVSSVLDFPIEIHNPFLYMTKAEVIRPICDQAPECLELSGSCWKTARVGGGVKHCGECVPCLIRRIAVEYNGLKLDEYAIDLLAKDIGQLPSDNTGKRNLIDLAEFVQHFVREDLRRQIAENYPELMSGSFDAERAFEMYCRFAEETLEVLSRYPGVVGILR